MSVRQKLIKNLENLIGLIMRQQTALRRNRPDTPRVQGGQRLAADNIFQKRFYTEETLMQRERETR